MAGACAATSCPAMLSSADRHLVGPRAIGPVVDLVDPIAGSNFRSGSRLPDQPCRLVEGCNAVQRHGDRNKVSTVSSHPAASAQNNLQCSWTPDLLAMQAGDVRSVVGYSAWPRQPTGMPVSLSLFRVLQART